MLQGLVQECAFYRVYDGRSLYYLWKCDTPVDHRATGFCLERNVFARSTLQTPCMFHVAILLVPPRTFTGVTVLILDLNPLFAKVCSCFNNDAPPNLGSWYMSVCIRLYFSSKHSCIMCSLLICKSFSLLCLLRRQAGVQYCKSLLSVSEGPV